MNIEDDIAFLYPVNDEWMGLLLADEPLIERDSIELLNNVSNITPMMHIYNADDHGWGFKVFNEGKMIAEFDCIYGTLDEEPMIRHNGLKPEVFQLFKLNEEHSSELVELLANAEVSHELVEKFKTRLGIEEFSWMSYSYMIQEYMNMIEED